MLNFHYEALLLEAVEYEERGWVSIFATQHSGITGVGGWCLLPSEVGGLLINRLSANKLSIWIIEQAEALQYRV
ncbi:hypothetical protein BDV23DRAFT_143629 [Aspergillus alliaceus]|uniref:Uncharacterized protein n=1 Tax=Petromyces alliaceus TaxID=209559 RepID=A0A5N7CPV4_PETAA|nr:hypothetical protein BDV23DRAFT_143629 [Aspergillus alliaceus]